MPRVATKLTPAARGGFVARKVIPADVKEDYAFLFGARTEERFTSGPVPIGLARAQHREWLSEIEARIANVRAGRRGDGRTLTPKEARALAGDWYRWFVARETAANWGAEVWDEYRSQMHGELQAAAIRNGIYAGDTLDLWEHNPAIREHVRPVVADEGKTETFLAAKRLTLDTASRAMWLDYVTRDFFEALALLARQARGDFSPDKHAEQFPQAALSDASLTPWTLFERWVAVAKPAISTVDRWRTVFLKMQADFPTTPAAALMSEQAQEWANGLVSSERSAQTVADVWVRSARTVWNWAIAEKLVASNPFIGWRIKVPRKTRHRETKAFTSAELGTILKAASAIEIVSKTTAARRWVPWLAAYTGARPGELTQLRGADVIEQDGIAALRLTPEAGTVKGGKARVVPIHEHLVAQGFLSFAESNGDGPLFYNEALTAKPADPTNPQKPRFIKAREHLASWVRGLGINDPELSPNHAWRHTFKAAAFRCEMREKITDAIVGHAPASVGRGYGEPTLQDKAAELSKFPRYSLAWRSSRIDGYGNPYKIGATSGEDGRSPKSDW